MLRASLIMALAGVVSSCGSTPPPPPPRGLVAEDLARLPDPLGALRERVVALEAWTEAYGDDPEAARVLARLARQIAGLLGRVTFDSVPLLAARLRTRVFFTLHESAEERRAAVEESRRLLAAIEERLPRGAEEASAP